VAVDVDYIISALNQEGNEKFTSAKINEKITFYTNVIQNKFPEISGSDLDQLLTLKILAVCTLDLGRDPYLYEKDYQDLSNSITDKLSQDIDPESIVDHQISLVGDIPDWN